MPATASLRALLTGLIDYAGLFPPAGLAMGPAVRNYATYLEGPHAWMLGRFICPASRLEEFRREAAPLLPREVLEGDPPWRVSVLIDGDLDENLDSVFAFNHEHADPERGLAVIDAVEVKAPAGATADRLDDLLERVPDDIFPFVEIPTGTQGGGGDPRGLVAALAGSGAGAKIRTGGITPASIPSPGEVAEFICACDAAEVAFKATAGLHHPVRGEHALTYEPASPRAVMHGFLNVFLGACIFHKEVPCREELVLLLEETDASRFRFDDRSAAWRNRQISTVDIAEVRDTFALSFGSCSFEEPVEDLVRLGLL
jgi:hypothetical protein